MKRKFVYKFISVLLLVAVLSSFNPGALVQADNPPPGIELNKAQKRKIERQVKEAGADDVFFPKTRGTELVVGIKNNGSTQYLVAWKEEDAKTSQLPEKNLPEAPLSSSGLQRCLPGQSTPIKISEEASFGASSCGVDQSTEKIANQSRVLPETAQVVKFSVIDQETFEAALEVSSEEGILDGSLSGVFGAKPAYAQTTINLWHGSYAVIYPPGSGYATAPLHLAAIDVDFLETGGASAIALLAGVIGLANPALGLIIGGLLEGVWFAGFWCYRQDDGEMDVYIPWGHGCAYFAGSVCQWYCA